MSEDIGAFLPLSKNIPKNYLKLSYPVHGNDNYWKNLIDCMLKNITVMK